MLENFINGEYVKSNTNQQYIIYNPATNKAIQKLNFADEQILQQAIDGAELAQQEWSKKSFVQRAKVMRTWANLVEQNSKELATLEVEQTGKPIIEALEVDLPTAYGAIDYYASLMYSLKGDYQQLDTGICITRPEPLGLVAAIGAWNYPLQIACWKCAPAIAAGNAVVFKPSELTPLTALKLAEFAVHAGLPKGLLNVVYGGGELGTALVSHNKINKISFTGSVATGQKILASSANNITPSTLELGGKSALIIFDDVEIKKAVTLALMANFYTQGEVCSNASRVFVHKNILDRFLVELQQQSAEIRVGLPMNESTQMGALISKKHLDSVLDKVNNAIGQGATCLFGGNKITDPALVAGNFMQPTILTNCSDDMPIVKDEIFGPVITVLSFDSESEVIERANNTPFGLAAGVASNDITKANRVINALDAGTCWINTYNVTPFGLPFGGVKQSGFGKENGMATLQQYCKMKTIYTELADLPAF
jgi:betaine-aldehyde dehydrogenase